MALFHFKHSPTRKEAADTQEQVRSLRAVLASCRALAQRERRWLTLTVAALVVTLAVLVAMMGAFLVVNREPLMQVAGRFVPVLGREPTVRDINAAYAAYNKRDDKRALRIARPLAEKGYARAQALLGAIYERGHAVERDDREALRWFHRAADQHDATAQLYLGSMYAEGRGVPQNYSQAAKWYRLAADQGDAQAMYNLGVLYAQGYGMPADNVVAHMWFNLAAAHFPTSDPRNREAAARNRDFAAKKMTKDEIGEAQEKARQWNLEWSERQNGS